MAGNTRGKLKEKFEGIHNNFDWATKHCAESLILIKEHNPKLSEAVKSLAEGIEALDKLTQNIYGAL